MKNCTVKSYISAVLLSCCSLATAENDSWKSFVTNSTVSGKFGMAYNDKIPHDDSISDVKLAWGFAELGVQSGTYRGLEVGAYAIVPFQLWESDPSVYDKVFESDYVLRDLYLNFQIPGTKTALLGGRRQFVKTNTSDGDSHQGFQVRINDIPRTEITGSIVHRWVNNAVTFLDSDGFDGWQDVSKAAPYADDYFYTAQAKLHVAPERLSITPFFNWLDNVMGAAGSAFDATQPLNDTWAVGFDGYYTQFINDHPESEQPDYENVDMYRVHAAMKHPRGFFGVGYYAYGEGKLPTKIGIFDRDDPLDQDDLIGTEDNDTDMLYLDCIYNTDRLRIKTKYGIGENRPLKTNFQEFNFWIFYDFTEHIEAGIYYVYTEYSTNVEPDYHRSGTSLLYKF